MRSLLTAFTASLLNPFGQTHSLKKALSVKPMGSKRMERRVGRRAIRQAYNGISRPRRKRHSHMPMTNGTQYPITNRRAANQRKAIRR